MSRNSETYITPVSTMFVDRTDCRRCGAEDMPTFPDQPRAVVVVPKPDAYTAGLPPSNRPTPASSASVHQEGAVDHSEPRRHAPLVRVRRLGAEQMARLPAAGTTPRQHRTVSARAFAERESSAHRDEGRFPMKALMDTSQRAGAPRREPDLALCGTRGAPPLENPGDLYGVAPPRRTDRSRNTLCFTSTVSESVSGACGRPLRL